MSSADLLQEPTTALRVDPWHPWFAWRPVRLYMTGRFAWLRQVHRRTVTKPVGSSCEYTDDPAEFPDLVDKS
jgi:hypothetical protein